MKFYSTERFADEYEKLPKRLQERADKALSFLLLNFRHPSLRTRKMEGQHDSIGRDIWEARVNQKYRFTFTIDADAYILYRIGPHDIERHPR